MAEMAGREWEELDICLDDLENGSSTLCTDSCDPGSTSIIISFNLFVGIVITVSTDPEQSVNVDAESSSFSSHAPTVWPRISSSSKFQMSSSKPSRFSCASTSFFDGTAAGLLVDVDEKVKTGGFLWFETPVLSSAMRLRAGCGAVSATSDSISRRSFS